MLVLFQTEWCPASHRVRQRLTELGIDYVARQVPAQQDERAELRQATGTDRVPVLVPDDGPVLVGAEEILRYLSERFEEPADAQVHRARAREHVPTFREANRVRRGWSSRGVVHGWAPASSGQR
jgi:glutathione S-transferase